MSRKYQPDDHKEHDMEQNRKLTQRSPQNEAGQAGTPQTPVAESIPWTRQLTVALRLLLASLLLCSVLYPAFVTLVSQTLWRSNAGGGIVELDREPVGAKLIGQPFNSDAFFHPRPSSKGYDAMDSGSQNLGPLNDALTERVRQRVQELREEGIDPAHVPIEWVTESGSSLDPHITPAAARLQVPRVSRASGLSSTTLNELIAEHTEGKFLGLFGWERVNVLLLNVDVQTHLGEQS